MWKKASMPTPHCGSTRWEPQICTICRHARFEDHPGRTQARKTSSCLRASMSCDPRGGTVAQPGSVISGVPSIFSIFDLCAAVMSGG